MRNSQTVIYWHRLGFKLYNVSQKSLPKLEKEVEYHDIEQAKIELKSLSGQSILLLLSDSISYLYEKILDSPLVLDNNFKDKLLNIIQPEIPEDFSEFIWDYKVEKTLDGKQKIIIFAPVKEFQTIINEISNSLNINIEAIETESIAAIRDPNPVLGIIKKTDIKGKDEEVLNLSVIPKIEKKKNPLKTIGLIFFIILIIFSIFFIIKSKTKNLKPPQLTPVITDTPVPTEIPTPSAKEWSELNLMIQNGTTKSGLASKTALIFKDSGINQVETSNADNNNYASNKLIFKDERLKENYQNKIKELTKINDENIDINTSIQYDIIFILGLN